MQEGKDSPVTPVPMVPSALLYWLAVNKTAIQADNASSTVVTEDLCPFAHLRHCEVAANP